MVLNAQMGKAGPPMDGKDLHIGDFDWGILPRGGAARDRRADDRRHGDGVRARRQRARRACRSSAKAASSLGEWHEAINLCAARTAAGDLLRREQPDRALDAGRASSRPCACSPTRPPATAFPGITIDGTDPDEIAAAFAWAAERARAGDGPTLIELVAMRMCGHAHHDDMLYLGKDPQPSWDYPPLTRAGLRGSRALCLLGAARSDLVPTRRGSRRRASSRPATLDAFKSEARGARRDARRRR